jgi:ketosteroid isomerase-like protein
LLKSTLLTLISLLPACGAAAPDTFKPEEIIALERTALDRWSLGDPQLFIELDAPEVTYFDPFQKQRVDGIEAMKRLMASIKGTFTIPRYELLNPTVQRHGEVAVLTFNLVNYLADGKVMNRWNATEVYSRIDGKWRIIHSHWSYTTPERK